MSRKARELLVLTIGLVLSVAFAYLLNPIFRADKLPGYEPHDEGFRVYFNGMVSDSQPVVSLEADDQGEAVTVTIDPLANTHDEARSGEIDIGRLADNGSVLNSTDIRCTAHSYVWQGDSLVGGPDGQARRVDAAPLLLQEDAELGYPNPGGRMTGDMTAVSFTQPIASLRMRCPIPNTARSPQSLANQSVLLPSTDGRGINGGTKPAEAVLVAKKPSEFIVSTSYAPDDTGSTVFRWTTTRMANFHSDQGIFLTTSTPSRQQKSDYRIYLSGALAGLAAGLLIAITQILLARTRP